MLGDISYWVLSRLGYLFIAAFVAVVVWALFSSAGSGGTLPCDPAKNCGEWLHRVQAEQKAYEARRHCTTIAGVPVGGDCAR